MAFPASRFTPDGRTSVISSLGLPPVNTHQISQFRVTRTRALLRMAELSGAEIEAAFALTGH